MICPKCKEYTKTVLGTRDQHCYGCGSTWTWKYMSGWNDCFCQIEDSKKSLKVEIKSNVGDLARTLQDIIEKCFESVPKEPKELRPGTVNDLKFSEISRIAKLENAILAAIQHVELFFLGGGKPDLNNEYEMMAQGIINLLRKSLRK